MSAAAAPRVAVLGASGVGRFHARELVRAGADVVAVLGSSAASAAGAAARLERELGIGARAFHTLDEVLSLDLDAVTVALPHELHFEAALRALTRGLFVFCEKPLFYMEGLTTERARPLLAELSAAGADARLAVNTSNASFVTALCAAGRVPERPEHFRFRLHTAGDDQHEEIPVDLLPHALSLLRELEPRAPLTDIRATCEQRRFTASFRAGELATSFELAKLPGGEKSMAFAIDDLEVTRVQRVEDGRYRVFLEVGSELLPVEDPFAVWLGAFVRAVRGAGPLPVDFDAAARNLLDMLRLLEAARGTRPGAGDG